MNWDLRGAQHLFNMIYKNVNNLCVYNGTYTQHGPFSMQNVLLAG